MNWSDRQFVFTEMENGEEIGWTDATLWKAIEGLEVQEMALAGFGWPIKFEIWSNPPSQEELAGHLERILNADLRYPIIVNAKGDIMDGYHRLAKSLLMNLDTVKVVFLINMPPPDWKATK